MSYTALYRKFRPVSFDDVKGQDHIVTTLRNQIRSDRIGHAYLFCGTRGTGKTTVAKIFARAVNCENPDNGSPCGQCPTCQAIASGAALNVIEIDAASNNGVDNVREIIDEVSYSPTAGRFKVYIIDEAHMLSPGAFNALLKTLEEPPEYVIFILATTEPHKLLVTIQSRCQRYDFHRITIDTIQSRLRQVCDEEGLSVEEHALRYIAKAGDGSMRDALSLLDQCVAFHYGETLTYDMTLDVLGAVDTGVFDRLLNALYSRDVVSSVGIISEVVEQGRELSQFNTDLIWYIRSVMLEKTDTGLEDVIDINSEDMARLKETASRIDMDLIMKYIQVLSELTSQLRYSSQKRILLEVAMIRLCRPEMIASGEPSVRASSDSTSAENPAVNVRSIVSPDLSLMLDDIRFRIEALEDRIESGCITADTSVSVKPELPCALPDDVAAVNNRWSEVTDRLEGSLAMYASDARRSITADGKLQLVWDGQREKFAYDSFNKPESRKMLDEAIGSVIGKKLEIEMVLAGDRRDLNENYFDIATLVKDIAIETEDDVAEGYI